MAVAGVRLDINAEELRAVRQNIARFFPKDAAAEVFAQAIDRALAPALVRLRENTPLGPTGNLRRAATTKIVLYKETGVAVGLLGYRQSGKNVSTSAGGGKVRAGNDRAFHQWWIEYGTQSRQVSAFADNPYRRQSHQRRMRSGKVVTVASHMVSGQNAYIASSFKQLGPFALAKTPRGPKQEVQTKPETPNAFFKKSKDPITIPAMPAGGSGEPPLRKTWDEYSAKVAESISSELRISLEEAWSALGFRGSGTITGTETL